MFYRAIFTLVKYFKYLLENCYVVIYKLKTIISIFCDQYTTLIFYELGIIYYTQSYENFTMVNLQLCVWYNSQLKYHDN